MLAKKMFLHCQKLYKVCIAIGKMCYAWQDFFYVIQFHIVIALKHGLCYLLVSHLDRRLRVKHLYILQVVTRVNQFDYKSI